MEKLQKKKWLFLVISAVFLVLWVVLGISSRSRGPEAVVQKFYKAYVKQNVNKIVNFYPPERRDEIKEELKADFSTEGIYADAISELTSDYKLVVGDVTYGKGEEKDTAVVNCAIIQKGIFAGADFNTLQLIKVVNKWYIDE